jgi:hypothetical protein
MNRATTVLLSIVQKPEKSGRAMNFNHDDFLLLSINLILTVAVLLTTLVLPYRYIPVFRAYLNCSSKIRRICCLSL